MSPEPSETKIKCEDLIYICISIPVSLIIFIVGKLYSSATNHNGKKFFFAARQIRSDD